MTLQQHITVHDDPDAVLAAINRVVVPVDGDDEAFDRTLAAATELAREHSWSVVLYDRSHERWTDTPHPTGPVALDSIDRDERPHLAERMNRLAAADIAVTAWFATVPALTAMIDVLQDLNVDGVMLPSEPEHVKLMDRLVPGGDLATKVRRVADLQLDRPAPVFMTVDEAGAVSILATESEEQ